MAQAARWGAPVEAERFRYRELSIRAEELALEVRRQAQARGAGGIGAERLRSAPAAGGSPAGGRVAPVSLSAEWGIGAPAWSGRRTAPGGDAGAGRARGGPHARTMAALAAVLGDAGECQEEEAEEPALPSSPTAARRRQPAAAAAGSSRGLVELESAGVVEHAREGRAVRLNSCLARRMGGRAAAGRPRRRRVRPSPARAGVEGEVSRTNTKDSMSSRRDRSCSSWHRTPGTAGCRSGTCRCGGGCGRRRRSRHLNRPKSTT